MSKAVSRETLHRRYFDRLFDEMSGKSFVALMPKPDPEEIRRADLEREMANAAALRSPKGGA